METPPSLDNFLDGRERTPELFSEWSQDLQKFMEWAKDNPPREIEEVEL